MSNEKKFLKRGLGFAALRETLEAYGEALALAEAGATGEAAESIRTWGQEPKKILFLAGGDGRVDEALARHAVSLARRLDCELHVLSVCEPVKCAKAHARRETFAALAAERVAGVLALAQSENVRTRHLVRFGKPGPTVNEVCTELRRVEFVVCAKSELGRAASRLLVPLFTAGK